MTPFANQLIAEMTRQDCYEFMVKGNETDPTRALHPDITLSAMAHSQYFEVSEVIKLAQEMMKNLQQDEGLDLPHTAGFLPAPMTWVEYSTDKIKEGWLLFASEDGMIQCFPAGYEKEDGTFNLPTISRIAWSAGETTLGAYIPPSENPEMDPDIRDYLLGMSIFVRCCLAIINTPRSFDRETTYGGRQQLKWIKQRGVETDGLRPITTVHLGRRSNGPGDGEGSSSTIGRALHFVRSFFRTRLGRIEFVTGHMRGNAAFGVIRKKYEVHA
jgi:hypothetical protein